MILMKGVGSKRSQRKRLPAERSAIPTGFVTFTGRGRIQDINLPDVQFLNDNGQRMLGLPFVKFIAKPDRQKFLDYLSRCRRNHDSAHLASVELQLTHKAGENPVSIELFAVPAAEKQTGQTVCKSILRDITQHKHMQEVHRWLAAIVECSVWFSDEVNFS
jgi:PAS domain S-box-containing protein